MWAFEVVLYEQPWSCTCRYFCSNNITTFGGYSFRFFHRYWIESLADGIFSIISLCSDNLCSSPPWKMALFSSNKTQSPMRTTEKSWVGPGWGYGFDTETLLLQVQGWDELVTSLIKSIPVPVHFLQGHSMSQWANWAENAGVMSYKRNTSTIFTPSLMIFKAFFMGDMTRPPKADIIWELIQNKVCSRSASTDMEQRMGVLQKALRRVLKFIQNSQWTFNI